MTKLFEHVCFDEWEWEWDERNFTEQLRGEILKIWC